MTSGDRNFLLLAGGLSVLGWFALRGNVLPAPAPSSSKGPRGPRGPRGRLTRRFDPLFDKYRGRIPLAYMRALAARESDFDTSDTTGGAWGLMQVVPVVLRSFNQRHGTSIKRAELLDAETNVRIASWTLQTIVADYARKHPATLAESWQERRYVELVTAGWNAGWSQSRGLQRVASWLEARSMPVTVDTVHAHAAEAGAVKWLSMSTRLRWWKSVAALYFAELEREAVA